MNKINKVISFIDYISKNMEKDDLFLLYKINNVKRERMEMLSDLTYSLNELILTTYLGDQFMNDEDRIKHIFFLRESVVSLFKKEGIYFLDCDELKK